MKKTLLLSLTLLLVQFVVGQSNFSTSLHSTREGKAYAYKAENGGMELITNIPMDNLACKKCHSTTGKYPNGDPIDKLTYAPSCKDCHDFSQGTTVAEQTCLNCHNRQVYERAAYPDADIHKTKGLTCKSCHSKAELHGDDGVKYNSIYEPGAIKVKCEDCHTPLPANTSHNIHAATVECAACHAVGVLSCASCHFETIVATGENRAINQLKNYRLLVKKEGGKIGIGAFMTHTYNGKTNYIINAYHSHAIQKNATTCADCHYNQGGTNVAIGEYNTTGKINMTRWNATTKKIMGPSGVVPLPSDWKTSLKFDFATYTGDPNLFPSDANAWTYLKSTVDNSHLFFCEPLDASTLTKLGFTTLPTGIEDFAQFNLLQNYPNPFNGLTYITYTLNRTSNVSLRIFDSSGRLIKTVAETRQNQGEHQVKLSATDLPIGFYYCKLEVNGKTAVKKMIRSN